MPQWMVLAASVLFELAMASLMGVRLLSLFRRQPPRAVDTTRQLLHVAFSVVALFVSSLVLLVFAGQLLLALGARAGGFAVGIFLAHTVLFPIVCLGVIRLWQEYALAPRPKRRRIAVLRELQEVSAVAGEAEMTPSISAHASGEFASIDDILEPFPAAATTPARSQPARKRPIAATSPSL